MSMSTWRELIGMATKGEPLIACTLSDEELDVEFEFDPDINLD